MYLLRNFLRCIIAFRKAFVIKGPSFARKYFFFRGACLLSVFVTTLNPRVSEPTFFESQTEIGSYFKDAKINFKV